MALQESVERPDEAVVALCFYGESLDPLAVTDELGTESTHAHAKGDLDSRGRPCAKGAWIYEIRRFAPFDVDAMFVELFSKLPAIEAVWTSLAGRFEMRVDLAIHTEAGTRIYLQPKTIELLAERHAEVLLDIYAYATADA